MMLDVAPPITGRGMLGGLPLISGGPRPSTQRLPTQRQQLRTDYAETNDSYVLTLDVPGASRPRIRRRRSASAVSLGVVSERRRRLRSLGGTERGAAGPRCDG